VGNINVITEQINELAKLGTITIPTRKIGHNGNGWRLCKKICGQQKV